MDADGDHSSMLYFLDTRTRQWVAPTVMGEPPAARAGHAAALLGARWLLAGGGGGDAPVITSLCLNLGTLEAGFVRWEAPVRLLAVSPSSSLALSWSRLRRLRDTHIVHRPHRPGWSGGMHRPGIDLARVCLWRRLTGGALERTMYDEMEVTDGCRHMCHLAPHP
jgi:hypothetical protein